MYEGKLVRLRAYRKEDAAQAQEYLNDPAVRRMLAPGTMYPYTLADEEQWIASNSALKDVYSFAIETKAEGRYIGGCGANALDWQNRTATIGIFIGPAEYRGRGYGSDALRVLVDFLFDQLNLNKIKLNVFSFNQCALACYDKFGFRREGVLRQELFRDGAYHDTILMALLREEHHRER